MSIACTIAKLKQAHQALDDKLRSSQEWERFNRKNNNLVKKTEQSDGEKYAEYKDKSGYVIPEQLNFEEAIGENRRLE